MQEAKNWRELEESFLENKLDEEMEDMDLEDLENEPTKEGIPDIDDLDAFKEGD